MTFILVMTEVCRNAVFFNDTWKVLHTVNPSGVRCSSIQAFYLSHPHYTDKEFVAGYTTTFCRGPCYLFPARLTDTPALSEKCPTCPKLDVIYLRRLGNNNDNATTLAPCFVSNKEGRCVRCTNVRL